jgi:hypothetical protein
LVVVVVVVVGGWWLVVGGWWLVVGGWWLVVGGCGCGCGWWLMIRLPIAPTRRNGRSIVVRPPAAHYQQTQIHVQLTPADTRAANRR